MQADSLLSEPPGHESVQIQVKYKLRYKIRAIVCEINLGLKFRHILVEKISVFGDQFDGSDSKESACNAGDLSLIPGSGRFLGEGNGHPL